MGVSPWTRHIPNPPAANAVKAGSNLAVAAFAANEFGISLFPQLTLGATCCHGFAAEIAAKAAAAERG